jgi:hypothetical protein
MTNPMKCDEFEVLLPDYLEENGPDAATRESADAHRLDCAACAALVADLKAIVRDAGDLPALAPPRDLWSGIEARIEAPVVPIASRDLGEFPAVPTAAPARLRSFTLRRFAIAASLLMAVTAGVTYTLTRLAQAPVATTAAIPAPVAGTVRAVSRPSAEVTFDREIATLRQIVDERRSELDPKTVAILDKNLRLIDAAIVESKAALARDPASGFLAQLLTQAYDSKLQLLRGVATLPARS